MMQEQSNKLGDLESALEIVWQTLMQGAPGRESSSRLCVLSTISEDGCPRGRNVILRGADRKTPSVMFFTDVRSRKISEIRANADVALTHYCYAQRFQIRLRGRASVHHGDALTEKAWMTVPEEDYVDYAGQNAPGHESGRPIHELGGNARENFAVVRILVGELEWLQLGQKGNHRRGYYRWSGAGEIEHKAWLAP